MFTVKPSGHVEVRVDTNGVPHRYVLEPGASLAGQPADVVAAAQAAWTPQVLAAWAAFKAAQPKPPTIDMAEVDNLDKVLKALAMLLRQYTNALQAGTHTQKTVPQLKSDFATIYRALP
jgi:hypothetical protein